MSFAAPSPCSLHEAGTLGTPTSSVSGSAGALPDYTLSRQTPTTWKDAWLLTATAPAPESTSSGATAASTPVLPATEGPVEEGIVHLVEVEPGSVSSKDETTSRPREVTQLATTQHAATARATTAQAPATSHPHKDLQPGHQGTSAPAAPGHTNPHSPSVQDGGPSATDATAEDRAPSQLPAGEGSGEPVSKPFSRDLRGLGHRSPLPAPRAGGRTAGDDRGPATDSS